MPTVSLENIRVLEFHERETDAAMQKMQENKTYLNAADLPYWEARYEFQQKKLHNIKQIQQDVRVQLEHLEKGSIGETRQLPGGIDG